MVRVEEHIQKIQTVKEQLKTATGYRKADLSRCLKRLNKELAEYKRLTKE